MHATDIVAWHFNGAAFCPDCQPRPDADGIRRAGGEPHPVFADALAEENGATCDACGACLVDGEWLAHDDAVGPAVTWWRCERCNTQSPHGHGDPAATLDDEDDERNGQPRYVTCPNCHGRQWADQPLR